MKEQKLLARSWQMSEIYLARIKEVKMVIFMSKFSYCSTRYYIYAKGEEESIGKYSVSNGIANPLLPLSAHMLHDEKRKKMDTFDALQKCYFSSINFFSF